MHDDARNVVEISSPSMTPSSLLLIGFRLSITLSGRPEASIEAVPNEQTPSHRPESPIAKKALNFRRDSSFPVRS